MPPAANAVQIMSDRKGAPDAGMTSPAPGPVSAPQDQPDGRVTELRVSANLMTLETGVYCVFPPPGSRSPDPATGLPGVRITRCPGMVGRPEAVSISTFREDGWLDNTAALVRVSDGPAQVLITIYQAAGQPAENSPRLQVLRLAGGPALTASEPPVTLPRERDAEVMAHVQGAGDVPGQFGEWIGKRGSRSWIEGFGISNTGPIAPGDIEYQGVLGRGWLSPWVENGKFCGSRGMALPLLGLNVRLKGAAAKGYTVRYSATFIDGSTVGPTKEGSACEAPGLAALEAFQIELVPKVGRAEGSADDTTTDHSVAAGPLPTRAPTRQSPARSDRR